MYYRAWSVVLAHIKEHFMEETGLTEASFYEKNETHLTQETYYLRNMQDNLIQEINPVHIKEFSSGKSVLSNLNYLASSYAMIFNLLGNQSVHILPNSCHIQPGNYDIEYKKTLRALKSKNAFVNVDASLLSKDGRCCVCFEMKMLEWFVFKVNPIKDTFMEADNYFYEDTAKVFMDTIQLLIPFLDRDGWEHLGIFQNCDGFLVLRQVLSLYNAIRMAKEGVIPEEMGNIERFQKMKDLTLLTVYWSAKNPDCYGSYKDRILHAERQMRKEAHFLQEIMEPVAMLFSETLDVRLKIRTIHYRKLLDMLEKTKEERKRLNRYDV